MIYVWIQDVFGIVSLVRLPNGNLGMPFGAKNDEESGASAAIRIARMSTGIVLNDPVDTYEGVLYSEIDVFQEPTVEGVVTVPMSTIKNRGGIDPVHREIMKKAHMI